jgi:uncharacterized protein (DUF1501 family)
MTGALGMGGAAAAVLHKLALTSAWAQTQTDYKALVCVFMAGGNDGNQTVIPLSGAPGFGSADVTLGYPAYSGERTPQGLAIAAASLLPINPGAANPTLGTFGLNPAFGVAFNGGNGISIPGLKTNYDNGQVAIVPNVGTLPRPLSKAQYQSGLGHPDQLFSHSDQVRENQTCIFTPGGATGWAGRTTDRTRDLFDLGRSFPTQTSISGAPQFMSGISNFPLVIGTGALNTVLVLNGFGTAADEVARKNAFNHLRTINHGANKLADAASSITDEAINVLNALSVNPLLLVPNPAGGAAVQLTFPNTTLGQQLQQVARVIKANLQQPALALKRQIFFVQVGGFDTHQNQNTAQPPLLQQVSQALAAFYYWLQNNVPGSGEPTLGDLTGKVTSFTMADFNRTFNPAGSGGIVGTDHAWGNHFFAVGGAVNGGFVGVPLPGGNGSVFPTLSKGTASPYDVDNGNGGRGRWIPSVSTLQYANTLAAWYGLPQDNTSLDTVFPLLRANFASAPGGINLGFV